MYHVNRSNSVRKNKMAWEIIFKKITIPPILKANLYVGAKVQDQTLVQVGL